MSNITTFNSKSDQIQKNAPDTNTLSVPVHNKFRKNKQASLWWSWKSWLFAFIIAFLINVLLSAATDTKPTKNLFWTVSWVYLSIEAWKYWRWKALLPYPLSLLVTYILIIIVVATPETDELFWVYVIVLGICNIGGLVLFYNLLQNSKAKILGKPK